LAQEIAREEIMSLFDDAPGDPRQPPFAGPSTEDSASLPGDPLSYVAPPPPRNSDANLPEDLRISWSWPHLLLFVGFVLASQVALGIAVIAYFSTQTHLTKSQLRHLVESDPKFLVGANVLEFGLIFLFLYVTLSVLRGLPFWSSLGWKALHPNPLSGKGSSWMYFVSGCGLSIFVAVAGSRVKGTENVPIQEFLKSRTGAMLFMSMAVLVAPLVEETVFRGYLYPLFARMISAIAQHLGMKSPRAIRTGMGASILITGLLFGLLHAPQLGWTWALVSLLTLVGVIFTFARAWTGTVLASFMLHLGYNSMIAITTVIATKGFTHLPPSP
jgi:membrane protease YdiL (CAAX protease family)